MKENNYDDLNYDDWDEEDVFIDERCPLPPKEEIICDESEEKLENQK